MFGIMKAVVKLITDNKKTKTVNLQTEGMDKQVKDAELLHPAGFFSKPIPKSSALTIQVSKNYSVVVAFADTNINIINLKEGERCIYSTDKDGAIKSQIFLLSNGSIELNGNDKSKMSLLSNGNIELNGNDKSLVTHTELDTALQKIYGVIKTHTHTTPQGPASPSVELASQVLDISASKTKTIKTGG